MTACFYGSLPCHVTQNGQVTASDGVFLCVVGMSCDPEWPSDSE